MIALLQRAARHSSSLGARVLLRFGQAYVRAAVSTYAGEEAKESTGEVEEEPEEGLDEASKEEGCDRAQV